MDSASVRTSTWPWALDLGVVGDGGALGGGAKIPDRFRRGW
jgi:hypothetical protein